MVKIIADSTCDLSEELLEKYDISIIPLHILLGEKEYLDGKTISPEEIYQWAEENHTSPETKEPSLAEVIEILQPFFERGDELVCFAISESMSDSARVIRMAVKKLQAEDKIWVINSANLSTGIGLLLIEASLMARKGASGKEIAEEMEKLKPLVRASFVMDTPICIPRKNNGRLFGLLSSLRMRYPKIVVEDGKMKPDKKYKGKKDFALLSYVCDMEDDLQKARTDRVFITHSGCAEDIILSIYTYLIDLNIFRDILVTRAGGVVSSHCGPGTLGVLFLARE